MSTSPTVGGEVENFAIAKSKPLLLQRFNPLSSVLKLLHASASGSFRAIALPFTLPLLPKATLVRNFVVGEGNNSCFKAVRIVGEGCYYIFTSVP